MSTRSIAAFLWLLSMPVSSYGHVEDAAAGFFAGLLHPVTGLDHFLAMLSVGIVSAQLGGKRVFIIPAVFVLAMIAGAVVGCYGIEWQLSEPGIAASVVVLGAFIVTASRHRGSLAIMAVVAFFGALHGHAHGLEMPTAADPVYYAAGFLLSTASIHLLGLGVGHFFTIRTARVDLLRYMGSAMAGMGLVILMNALQ